MKKELLSNSSFTCSLQKKTVITNHIWFNCKECGGDELKLKMLLSRLLHHICNDNDYCQYDELDDKVEGRMYLDSNSCTTKELRDFVMDKSLLAYLCYYRNNHHTGMLEVGHTHANINTENFISIVFCWYISTPIFINEKTR